MKKLYKICAFTLFVKAVVSSDTCFQLNNMADESIRSRTLDGKLQTVPGMQTKNILNPVREKNMSDNISHIRGLL